MVEPLQPMQIVQIPCERSVFAVDLEGVEGLMTAGVTGSFEGRQRSVLESGQECTSVIDPNLLLFAGQIVFALLYKGFGDRRHRVHFAVDPDSGVDAMSQQITGYTAPGHI